MPIRGVVSKHIDVNWSFSLDSKGERNSVCYVIPPASVSETSAMKYLFAQGLRRRYIRVD